MTHNTEHKCSNNKDNDSYSDSDSEESSSICDFDEETYKKEIESLEREIQRYAESDKQITDFLRMFFSGVTQEQLEKLMKGGDAQPETQL